MAITIISTPNTNQPAFNQMLYTVSSNNVSNNLFNYLADVYVGATLGTRLMYPKQGTGIDTITLDISPIVRNYVSYDISNVYGKVHAVNTLSRAQYYVQFGEQYYIGPSGPNIFPDLLRSPGGTATNTATNSIYDFEIFTSNILDSYDIAVHGPLLNIPDTITINPDQNLYLSYYDKSNAVTKIGISDGVTITYTGVTGINGEYLYNINAGKLIKDKDNYISPSYFITFNTATTQLYRLTVNVEESCSKFETVRLHWLNNLGGWDSYNFDMVSVKSANINRNIYKKTMSKGYTTDERLKTVYQTTMSDSILVNSDWLNTDMLEWMEDLFTSPIVFLERGTDDLVAVNVTDNTYAKRNYGQDRQLHNVTFTIEFSYNRNRQSL